MSSYASTWVDTAVGHGLTRLSTVIGSMMLTVMLLSCTTKEPAPPALDEGEQAAAVALKCYKALYIDDRPETFLRGRLSTDRLSDDQQQQLLQLYKQHVLQVGRQHGGVSRIDFLRAERDTALNIMQVFLKMNFGDATNEEVVVPMVLADDKWRMK